MEICVLLFQIHLCAGFILKLLRNRKIQPHLLKTENSFGSAKPVEITVPLQTALNKLISIFNCHRSTTICFSGVSPVTGGHLAAPD